MPLTFGLQNLRGQLDRAFPDRGGPDGTIGDRAHQERESGHNPDDTPGSKPTWDGDADKLPEIRGLDVSVDGIPAAALVRHITTLPGLSAVLRFIIFDHEIYHVRNAFIGVPYSGANPHTEHIHFEGAYTQAADNNTNFNYLLEKIPVALTAEDKKWLSAEIRKIVTGDADPTEREYSLGGMVAVTEKRTAEIRDKIDALDGKLFPHPK